MGFKGYLSEICTTYPQWRVSFFLNQCAMTAFSTKFDLFVSRYPVFLRSQVYTLYVVWSSHSFTNFLPTPSTDFGKIFNCFGEFFVENWHFLSEKTQALSTSKVWGALAQKHGAFAGLGARVARFGVYAGTGNFCWTVRWPAICR